MQIMCLINCLVPGADHVSSCLLTCLMPGADHVCGHVSYACHVSYHVSDHLSYACHVSDQVSDHLLCLMQIMCLIYTR